MSGRLRSRRVRVLPATRVGALPVPTDTVDAVLPRIGGAGLVVGHDRDGTPVPVTLFRAEPTVAVAIGSLGFVQVLILRALAVGAHAVVQTARPTAWEVLARLASPGRDRLSVTEQPVDDQPGRPAAPRLLVVDRESAADLGTRRGSAWTTGLTWQEQVSQLNMSALAAADLVLTQGLSATEARLVGEALDLDRPEAELAGLAPDAVVVAGRAARVPCRLAVTPVERWLLAGGDAAR